MVRPLFPVRYLSDAESDPELTFLEDLGVVLQPSLPSTRPFLDPAVREACINRTPPFETGVGHIPFDQVAIVLAFIAILTDRPNVSASHMRRLANKLLSDLRVVTRPIRKPHAFDVHAMFDRQVFRWGPSPVAPGVNRLNVGAIASFHRAACARCRDGLTSNCHIGPMLKCLTHGFNPPLRHLDYNPHYSGNYPRAAVHYPATVWRELCKLLAQNSIVPLTHNSPCPSRNLPTPLNIVLKKSELSVAAALSTIDPLNDESLNRLNSALARHGVTVKPRLILDSSASGLNDMLPTKPFSYGTINDALALVTIGGIMCKLDVKAYFNWFPLAAEFGRLITFCFATVWWRATCLTFGTSIGPYFASTWSAEFRTWFTMLGIPTAHLLDDWFTCSPSYRTTFGNLVIMKAVFTAIGMATVSNKEDIGSKIVFLGFLIDSSNMSVSFAPANAKAYAHHIRKLLLTDVSTWSTSALNSLAGKLNNYAEVLQQGRMHIRSVWQYLHSPEPRDDYLIPPLVDDLQWWLITLDTWASGNLSTQQFPIVNTASLATNPTLIKVVQSDYSGSDGFGWIDGPLNSVDPSYFSAKYHGRRPPHSHAGELDVLLSYLRHATTGNSLPRGSILFWLTDNSGSAWSVNSGYCPDDSSFTIVSEILALSDTNGIYLIGLWVPREQNTLPDLLSHLACSLNRSDMSGNISELSSASLTDPAIAYAHLDSRLPPRFRNLATSPGSSQNSPASPQPSTSLPSPTVPSLLQSAQQRSVPGQPPLFGALSLPFCAKTPKCKVSLPDRTPASSTFHDTPDPLARLDRFSSPADSYRRLEIRRSQSVASEVPINDSDPRAAIEVTRPIQARSPHAIHSPVAGPRRPLTSGRAASPTPRPGHPVGSESSQFSSVPSPPQNPPLRPSNMGNSSFETRAMRRSRSQNMVRRSQSSREARGDPLPKSSRK